ncbi:MAG: hypothetical protein COZ05_11040, partial [Armatimonadetes bacterium CG_4_10_14_3_um_filter_59_10]
MFRHTFSPAILSLLILSVSSLTRPLRAEDTNRPEHRPEIVVPYMRTPPVIDGAIHEDEWQCTKVKGFISQQRANRLEFRDGEFRIGHDDKNIYLAVKSVVHPEVGLIATSEPTPGKIDDLSNGDDSVELFFAPNVRNEGKATKAGMIYQIIFNGKGALHDIAIDKVKNTFDINWRVDMKMENSVQEGYWHVEAAITLASIPGGALDDLWALRVCRNFKNPWDQSRFGINVIAFADAETMPQMRFRKDAPIVKQLCYQSEKQDGVDHRVSVTNPTDKPLAVKVQIGHNPIDQPRYYKTETFNLEPGESEVVQYALKVSDPNSYSAASIIRVTSPDDRETYFLRDFLWDMRPNKDVWTPVPKADARAVTCEIAHYPSLGKLVAHGSFNNLKGKEAVKSIRLVVVEQGQGKALVQKTLRQFRDFSYEAVLSLPRGMDGDYEVRAYLSGDKNTPKESIVAPFERRRFEWENNAIGISDEVIPPFTPLVVNETDRAVAAVLRKHTLTAEGLWSQVAADGVDLLAAPMRYEVTAGGMPQSVHGGRFVFTRKAGNRVVGKGSFTTNELQATTTIEFDYDGMMKTTLDLRQNGKAPIEKLDLVIPLRAEVAKLMHPLGDGMRFNYGGVIPEGEGIVWESKNASRNRLLGTFLPYFWFGDEYRGLCWFAESDRGWKTNDEKSALTLERRGDQVVLRVHFVNKPGVFERPTRIVFGLMASPAKPLPKDPSWQTFTTGNDGGPGYNVRVMGSSFYWNGQMYANFPQNRDFQMIRKFAEANKEGKSDKEYFQKLVDSWSEETHDLDFNYNKAHILNGGGDSHFDAVVPYTNLRGDVTYIPEWRTFQDEWSWKPSGKRVTDKDRKKGSTDFATAPVRSRQDFLLYYYKKFFESGFDGIYWDNIYLQSCFSPLMGPAYIREDRQLQPYVDIFHSRELLKRAAVLAHQLEKVNVNMVHMTNTNIVPEYSFA